MYNGIGLQTARGSGTNGYVQTNKFFVRPKTGRVTDHTKGYEAGQGTAGLTRKPNKEILEHERKRQIHLKLVVLEDKLVEQGFTEAEIAEKLQEARTTLEAASAEDHGGPTAIVVHDTKVSETETHQIAARKEKQMEMFRAALGIATSEPDEQLGGGVEEGNGNDEGPNDDNKWHKKNEHAFLDRESSWKRRVEEDGKVEKDDKKKGVKDVKSKEKTRHRNKKDGGKRRYRDDSSDSDSSSEQTEDIPNKYHKGSHKSGHESDSDLDNGKKKGKFSKKQKKNRKHCSDSSDSSAAADDSDASSDDHEIGKVSSRKVIEKYGKSRRRHDSDDDSEGLSEHKSRKGKQHKKTREQLDSEDDSDSDSGRGKKRNQPEKQSKQQGGSLKRERDNSDVEPQRTNSDSRYRKNSRSADVDDKGLINRSRRNDTDDDSSDASRDDKIDKLKRHRRHDSDDDDLDSTYGRKNDKVRAGRPKADKKKSAPMSEDSNNSNTNSDDSQGSSDTDSVSFASDYRRERSGRKFVGNKRSGNGDMVSDRTREKSGPNDALDMLRKLEEKSLYQSRRENGDRDGSRNGHREVITGKRNFDDGNREEKRETKLRSQIVGKEADQEDHHAGAKIESEINSRWNKDDRRGVDLDYKERVGGRRHSRDEEEHKGRKRHRDEEEDHKYRRHEKDDEEPQRGSRRYGSGEEEERGSKGHEWDRDADYYSKRGRYDGSRSSEKKRYEYKHSDDRGRRRD